MSFFQPLFNCRWARHTAILVGLCAAAITPSAAHAQAESTATQRLTLSAFGGITGTYTGLQDGRNAALTVGGDITFLPIHRLFPSIELRGTEPFAKGAIDAEKNVLVGLKVGAHLGRLQPYGNLLVGRGSIEYLGDGLQVPGKPIYYTLSHSTVYSPGVGFDFQLAPQWYLKLDGQYQRYSTPVTTSGTAYAKSGTVALVYRLDFNRHRHIGTR